MKKKEPLDLQQLSDGDIIRSFYYSQGLLFILGCVGYLVFHKDIPPFSSLFSFQPSNVLFLGIGSGVLIACLELGVDRVVPESWFDDGGINRRIFQAFSYLHIVLAVALVAVIEESLFRGVIQTKFGLILASLIFGFVHVRYIKKPLMLVTALSLGFYLGWIYIFAQSLIVPIATHFTIDLILGYVLKLKDNRENTIHNI